jgi:hypothetical protein
MKEKTIEICFFGTVIFLIVLLIGVTIYGGMSVENKTITVTVKEKIYQPSTEVLIFGHHEAYYIISEDSAGNMYKTKTNYATYGELNRGDDIYLDVNVSKAR